jgi:hypothetical protein
VKTFRAVIETTTTVRKVVEFPATSIAQAGVFAERAARGEKVRGSRTVKEPETTAKWSEPVRIEERP